MRCHPGDKLQNTDLFGLRLRLSLHKVSIAETGRDASPRISLPQGREVTLEIDLK
jgi:hypothetical protein